MIRQMLADQWRFLMFRRMSPAVAEHWRLYLAVGLFFTWIAGVGRYWDNPRAKVWQHLGLGSVVYVFVLALLIWAILAPLKPRNWSYRNVLLMITLTAPPAILYAVPVERFLNRDDAVLANMWFLGLVAAWRVALFANFLRRAAALSIGAVIVGTLLPLAVIVVALTALNLEHVVFSIMGGLRASDRSANDGAYTIVLLLSVVSVFIAPLLVIAYAVLIARSGSRAKPPVSTADAGAPRD
jgi:hypothetical protein